MPLDKKTLLTTVKEAKSKSKERKFIQSVDLILDIKELDMKAPEGRIQQVVELPHVTGKPNKICVFATGELALKARNDSESADFGFSNTGSSVSLSLCPIDPRMGIFVFSSISFRSKILLLKYSIKIIKNKGKKAPNIKAII